MKFALGSVFTALFLSLNVHASTAEVQRCHEGINDFVLMTVATGSQVHLSPAWLGLFDHFEASHRNAEGNCRVIIDNNNRECQTQIRNLKNLIGAFEKYPTSTTEQKVQIIGQLTSRARQAKNICQ